MNKDIAELVERLEYTAKNGLLQAANDRMYATHEDAASTIRALVAENERLQRHVEILQDKVDPDKSCACGYDDPDHVCMVHSPKLREAVEVIRRAQQFIRNGVDLGFIRMPDPETPDTAHETLPLIDAFLATMEKPNDP